MYNQTYQVTVVVAEKSTGSHLHLQGKLCLIGCLPAYNVANRLAL